MFQAYKTQEEFLQAVSASLAHGCGSDGQLSALLVGISKADSDLRSGSAAPGSAALNLKVGAWVIRDQDVPIFAALNATAAAVIGTLTTAGVAWPLIATALSALAEVCWRAWRKGAHLTSAQVRVYGLLQAHGPLSIEGLGELLKKLGEPIEPGILKSTLDSLTDVELGDGDIIHLAKRNGDVAWQALRI
jgi:hypothetical protein